MDTNDYCAIPQQLKDQVSEKYPGARRAILKTGGDFPFLSRPDEVNLYLQLHLRRVGVEAKPDQVPGISRDGSAGSSNDKKRFDEHPDDTPQDDRSSGAHDGDHLSQSFGSETHSTDGQVSTSAEIISMVDEIPVLAHALYIVLTLHFCAVAVYATSKSMVEV